MMRQLILRSLTFLLAAFVAVVAWAHVVFPEAVREYRLYLLEDRPNISFRFEELSEQWTESDLKLHFSLLHFDCYPNAQGRHLDDRSCFADIKSYNSAPAMTASFFFSEGKLNRAAIIIPSWAHRDHLIKLREAYGKPSAWQRNRAADVPLLGWELGSDGALFYNRKRPTNPLKSNGIFWSSSRACTKEACFNNLPLRAPA